jgi:Uma2 family endonuclease
MTAPKKLTYLTVEQYLESEAHAAVRREYVDGQVFAMTGATRRHNIIVGNIHSLLLRL